MPRVYCGRQSARSCDVASRDELVLSWKIRLRHCCSSLKTTTSLNSKNLVRACWPPPHPSRSTLPPASTPNPHHGFHAQLGCSPRRNRCGCCSLVPRSALHQRVAARPPRSARRTNGRCSQPPPARPSLFAALALLSPAPPVGPSHLTPPVLACAAPYLLTCTARVQVSRPVPLVRTPSRSRTNPTPPHTPPTPHPVHTRPGRLCPG